MSKTFNVAVVGATGAVGETMLEILAQRNFPVGEVYALASSRSAGKKVPFGDKMLTVQDLSEFDFTSGILHVYDMLGQLVSSVNFRESQTAITIQTQDWPAGIYNTSVLLDGALLQSQRLVITK